MAVDTLPADGVLHVPLAELGALPPFTAAVADLPDPGDGMEWTLVRRPPAPVVDDPADNAGG